MPSIKKSVAYASAIGAAVAAPAAGGISNASQLSSAIAALPSAGASNFQAGYSSIYSAVQPGARPTDAAGLAAAASSAQAAFPTAGWAGAGAAIIQSGMAGGNSIPPFGNPTDDISNFGACNNANNQNTREPTKPVYPSAASGDAPYDISEQTLRSAIYIPSNFTYGKTKPVIFIPGTGVEACESFANNLGKLAISGKYGDPVYVNVPNNMLDDVQNNAEFVAYAVNYISGISGNRDVAVGTWSQGGAASQWALKYWPSTRKVVSDMVTVSSAYHGTIEVPLICPPGSPCAPSVLQQFYFSVFTKTLLANGGDSAYVPTTNIFSIFDEIVEPQQFPFASAMLNDARGVGVSNVQVQSTCPPGTPAGGPNFGHENSLYNAVSSVVFKDALTNAGPGNTLRAGAYQQCTNFIAQNLTISDAFATEALIPLAGFNIITANNKVTQEPPIKAYAAKDAPFGAPIAN